MDQTYALCRSTDGADVLRPYANQFAVRRHHQNVRILLNAHDRHDFAIFVGGLHVNDPFATPSLSAVLLNSCTLAETTLRDRKDHIILVRRCNHADNVITFVKTNTDHPIRLTAHFTYVRMQESNTHAVMC